MSGSRAIVLSLSVRDADVVRQQLVQMGEQGERALQRLDAAAQRSASGAGMPALARSTQEASANTGRFSQAVGSAGYQIQDFAVQVQMGQNALSAFGAQASQFLGVFGTGGAIAGAILTVGILAAQLLLGRDNAAELAKVADEGFRNTGRAAEDLARIIERVNDLYLTQSERALRAGEANRLQLLEQLRLQQSNAVQMQEGSAMELPSARRDLEREERRLSTIQARNERLRRAGSNVPLDEEDDARSRVFTARGRIQGLEADLNRQSSRIGQISEAIRRAELAGVDRGEGEYGPPAPAAARPGRVAMGTEDVEGFLAARTADLTRQFDAYSQAVNLSTAGLEGATSVLTEYARQQELLTTLLEAGIITEAQFGEEVERTSERLREQIEETQRRTERTSQFANQLGFSFSSAFEDAILKGKSFSDVLKGLEQDIARVIIRSAITAPLGNAIAGGVQSIMPSFGGARADGGPVTGGMAYLVGERGPEIVVPRSSGTVIANDRIGGPSITQNFNIDARGADASMVPRLRAEMVAIARASNAELLDSIQRGGSAARIVGRRA